MNQRLNGTVVLAGGLTLLLIFGWHQSRFSLSVVRARSNTDSEVVSADVVATSPLELRTDVTGEWDFGVVSPGESGVCELAIHNHEIVPLTIVNIETSCSCTVASLSSKFVPLEGSVVAKVRYVSPLVIGDHQQSVLLRARGKGVSRTFRLLVKSTVRKPLSVLPEESSLDVVQSGGSETFRFCVENHSALDWSGLEVLPLSETGALLDVDIREVLNSSESARQRFEVICNFVPGPARSTTQVARYWVRPKGGSGDLCEEFRVVYQPSSGFLAVPGSLLINDLENVPGVRLLCIDAILLKRTHMRFETSSEGIEATLVRKNGRTASIGIKCINPELAVRDSDREGLITLVVFDAETNAELASVPLYIAHAAVKVGAE